jgi:hypothetical protein
MTIAVAASPVALAIESTLAWRSPPQREAGQAPFARRCLPGLLAKTGCGPRHAYRVVA